MKQFLKRFRIPLIVVGVLCLLSATALITHRAYAVKSAQDEGKSTQSTLTDGGAQTAQEDNGAQTQQTESTQTPEIDAAEAVSIVFSDGGVQTAANEDAVKVEGTDVTIRASGAYTLSGSCADGSVTVKKETKGVTLILDGLNLTAENTAAISCNKGTEVTILAADGTVSTLADTEKNNDETNPANELAENAVIKCKDGAQVRLGGTGTLNILANGKNGVKAGASTEELGEASLTISDLTLSVTAPNDGIKADSALTISGGRITVSAGDDAVRSDTAVTIGAEGTDGPTLEISGCTEGIEAPQVTLLSGDVRIQAEDDGINASGGAAASDITVAGGTLLVDVAQGDGLDSNGSLNITGGDVRVFSSSRSDNSPIDSDGELSITGGTVLAIGSSGMAQAPNASAQTYVVFSAGNSVGGPGGGFGGGANAASAGFSLAAGDKVQITDENGNVLAETEALRQADYVYFTAPELADGQTCTLSVNGQSVGTAQATEELGAFGGMAGGGNRPGKPGGGNFDAQNMPQMPEGDFDPENMPQPPEGEFDPENRPQPPDGNFGSRPQRPGGTDGQTGATPDADGEKEA